VETRERCSPSYSWETRVVNVVPKIPDRSSHSHPVRSLSRFSSTSSHAIYIVPLTIPGINMGCLSEKFGTSSIIFFCKPMATQISKFLTHNTPQPTPLESTNHLLRCRGRLKALLAVPFERSLDAVLGLGAEVEDFPALEALGFEGVADEGHVGGEVVVHVELGALGVEDGGFGHGCCYCCCREVIVVLLGLGGSISCGSVL